MRPLPILFALLAACASSSQEPAPSAPSAEADAAAPVTLAPTDTLDVQAWLAEVRALGAEALDYDTLVARSLRLAGRLDPVVGWRRACDTYHDPSTGEDVYDPLDPEREAGVERGVMDVTPLGEREAGVAVLCNRGAYQGSWALIHVADDRASLVRTLDLDENYVPTDVETAAFGEPLFEPGSRVFTTFVRSRGVGGCGALSRYRLREGGHADILEVRAQQCSDEPPEELSPDTWPIVYPR